MTGAVNTDGLPLKEIAVSLSSLKTVREEILGMTEDMETAKKAVLVFDELLTNIVEYSGAKKAWYGRGRSAEGLTLVLRDDGTEFDPTAYTAEGKDPLDFDSGGMGLSMVAQTVSEWGYCRENGMNTVIMKIDLSENQHGA